MLCSKYPLIHFAMQNTHPHPTGCKPCEAKTPPPQGKGALKDELSAQQGALDNATSQGALPAVVDCHADKSARNDELPQNSQNAQNTHPTQRVASLAKQKPLRKGGGLLCCPPQNRGNLALFIKQSLVKIQGSF
ncbi:hypothetical protein [Campylobacter troglodytis]|uniref:hypothetical protein n=1 Tax=Campylobacter troglodytis TaxID=654363 RepID=UPI001157F7FD|nr:hypothetical protein [Campylobacter troglodytis]TQR48859.1 hypothetical protein DMC01_13010 [Campylobacter troglodytis]